MCDVRKNTAAEKIIRKFFSRQSGQAEIRSGLTSLYPRLWRFALVLTGDKASADDLAQETATRAIENAEKFQPGTSLHAWLFTIARRIWLNDMRAQKVRNAGGLVPIEETDLPAPEPDTETNIFAREVFARVMDLPEAQRVTVLLVYVEGYKYREAADILGIQIGTVMSRLAAARNTLTMATEGQRADRG